MLLHSLNVLWDMAIIINIKQLTLRILIIINTDCEFVSTSIHSRKQHLHEIATTLVS